MAFGMDAGRQAEPSLPSRTEDLALGGKPMPDLLGYRAKMGVIVPSTNTTMEPEMHSMAPRGVTFHTARIYIAQASVRSPEEARDAVEAFGLVLHGRRDGQTTIRGNTQEDYKSSYYDGGIRHHRCVAPVRC